MLMLVQKLCSWLVLLLKVLNYMASLVKWTIYEYNALNFGEFRSAKIFGEQCT